LRLGFLNAAILFTLLLTVECDDVDHVTLRGGLTNSPVQPVNKFAL